MSENPEQNNVRNFIRRYWWIWVIIILILIFLCGFSQAEQILKLFNPPQPTETVTEPPPDRPTAVVTEQATEATEEASATPTDEPTRQSGDGACNATCDPQASNCLAGLSCVKATSSDKFICWNSDICLGETTPVVTESSGGDGRCACQGVDMVCTKPDGTKTYSFNSTECGGDGKCGCRDPNKTWACPDGTYANFNPNCGVGGTGGCTYTCYNYVCETACGENYSNCPSDCP